MNPGDSVGMETLERGKSAGERETCVARVGVALPNLPCRWALGMAAWALLGEGGGA